MNRAAGSAYEPADVVRIAGEDSIPGGRSRNGLYRAREAAEQQGERQRKRAHPAH